MEELKQALEEYVGQDQGDALQQHLLVQAADKWGAWVIKNTRGERRRRGIRIVDALCSYAELDVCVEPEKGKP